MKPEIVTIRNAAEATLEQLKLEREVRADVFILSLERQPDGSWVAELSDKSELVLRAYVIDDNPDANFHCGNPNCRDCNKVN